MSDGADFKSDATTVKLFLSSLFARKLPVMIVNYMNPGVFYFTNIEPERIALYKATPEDVISSVKVVSENVMNTIYRAFPLFNVTVLAIDVAKFSTALNKALQVEKEKFPELVANRETRRIYLVYKDKTGEEVSVDIGTGIAEWDAEFYGEILDKFWKFSPNVIKRKFNFNSVEAESKVAIEIVEVSGKNGSSEFGLPVSDGFNLVSAREYIKKRALDPVYELLLQFDEGTHTSKATIHYLDDWFDVQSVMPGSLWFMTRKVL